MQKGCAFFICFWLVFHDIGKIFSVLDNKVALLARDALSREQEIVTKEFLERFYLSICI